MDTARSLALAFGLAFGAGLNLPATIAVLGLAARFGVVGPLPSTLAFVTNEWVIAIALAVAVIEFTTTCVPGVGTAWETVQGIVRPPLAGVLAAMVVWRDDAHIVVIAVLGGMLIAIATHTARLGARYALDTTPRTAPSVEFNLLELALVTALVLLLWRWPIPAFLAELLLLAVFVVVARTAVVALRQVATGHWMPGRGLLQEPRVPIPVADEDDDEEGAPGAGR